MNEDYLAKNSGDSVTWLHHLLTFDGDTVANGITMLEIYAGRSNYTTRHKIKKD